MTKKVVKPTEPFKPTLILRTQDGVMDRYKSFSDLRQDMWAHGVSMHRLYSNALSHGHFRRSDGDVEMGRNRMAALSLRWCTGESALEDLYAPAIYVMDNRKPRKGRVKRWVSKKRHKKYGYRNVNRVTRTHRYGEATMDSEGEPPVRRWKDSISGPYDNYYDSWVSRSWKDQSKCRKQWQRKLK